MLVKEITGKKELNTFVTENKGGQFLQSFEWGELQKSVGRRVWRLGAYASDGSTDHVLRDENKESPDSGSGHSELAAVATVIEHTVPFSKSYLYCPYGPVYRDDLSHRQKQDITKLILSKARDITIETETRHEIFFRIEPRISPDELGNFFLNMGLRKTQAVQPQDTRIIDLTRSEEQLLADMHHKTRYNIRLAERKGVAIREGKDLNDFEIFWQLMELTARRDNFHPHPKIYYQKLWEPFHFTDVYDQMDLTVKLLIAAYNNRPLAANLLILFGDRATYAHGASNTRHRHLMAPHLLQWKGILLAREAGYRYYDVGGVRPEKRQVSKREKEYAWDGITRFKKSFGGHEVNYIGAWDWVYDKKWYFLYQWAKRLHP